MLRVLNRGKINEANSDCSPADEVAKVAEASAEVAEVAEAPAAAEPANAEAEPANAEAEHHPNIRYDRRGLGSYKVSCPYVPGICRKFPCKLYGKVGALKNAQVWLAYMEKESIRLQGLTSAELKDSNRASLVGSSSSGPLSFFPFTFLGPLVPKCYLIRAPQLFPGRLSLHATFI